ncbi:MAG TPA: family 43 glycosylhydrolase [Bacteroidales bacterium]|nr:family 43 glycosylhydrolase [Bacteroidales bacterium]
MMPKKTIALVVLLCLVLDLMAQYQTRVNSKGPAYFTNPIFSGDYPDPSILREGDTYYMVHSSFEYYPGLLIWESKDLINWTPIGNALFRNVGSVWAPDITKANGKYYIYFPASGKNYVVFANSIRGPWSDPIELKVEGIDPGHFVDQTGKRFLYLNSGSYVLLSDDGLAVDGDVKHAYDGWPIPKDWSIELFALEGPKVTKHGDYYYLTVAEGGTAGPPTGHMIISARSKSPFGPWENSPYNPIIRTEQKSEQWWSKGHGTLIDDVNGKWWLIFHAYEKDYLNMGRQTLLEPVAWTKDGWFRIPKGAETTNPMKRPFAKRENSNFALSDDFAGQSLSLQWKFYQEYDTSRFHLEDNALVIKGKGSVAANCSPLLCVPADHSYTADVEMTIEGDATGGLVMFYNSSANSGILANSKDIITNLRGWQFASSPNVSNKHVFLRLKNIENTVDMYYSLDGIDWVKSDSSIEVSSLNHNALSGFISLRIGLCSIGNGSVKFKNFKYQAIK